MYNISRMRPQKIEISSRTIIFTVLFLLGLGFLWQIQDLLFSLLIAFIIAGALKPAVAVLEKIRLPRFFAALIIYLLFLSTFFFIFTLIIPPLAGELVALFKSLPNIIATSFPHLNESLDFNFLSQNLPGLANQTVGFIKGVFSNAVFITSTIFFGFYLLAESNLTQKLFGNFFEDVEIKKIELISDRAQKRMSSWFWGEIILMVVVGSLTYLGLTVLGVKYALALAVLAGILEVIPNLGPIVSSIPAILIGASQSLFLGVSMAVLYFIVQQLENNLVVPYVMKKVTGLHPLTTLIALIIGGKLAGLLGLLLAVPTTILLETVLIEWHRMR